MRYRCPNCAGRIEHTEGGAVAHCAFCGTQFPIPREPEAPKVETPRALGPRDVVVPALGCAAIYAVVFMVVSLLLSAAGLQERLRPLIAAVAIVAAVTTFVLMIRRRQRR